MFIDFIEMMFFNLVDWNMAKVNALYELFDLINRITTRYKLEDYFIISDAVELLKKLKLDKYDIDNWFHVGRILLCEELKQVAKEYIDNTKYQIICSKLDTIKETLKIVDYDNFSLENALPIELTVINWNEINRPIQAADALCSIFYIYKKI